MGDIRTKIDHNSSAGAFGSGELKRDTADSILGQKM